MLIPFLLDGGTNAEGKDIGTGSFSRAQYTKNMAWIDIFEVVQRHGPNISLLLCNLIINVVIELDKAVNVFYFLLSQLLFCSFTIFKTIVKLKSKDDRLFNFIKFIRLFSYITTVDCIQKPDLKIHGGLPFIPTQSWGNSQILILTRSLNCTQKPNGTSASHEAKVLCEQDEACP